jgi:nitrogen fixation NifU-like protein
MDLRELYQDIILDHGRHPRNFHAMAEPSHFAHGHNPLCGDKVTVYLQLAGERIEDVSFEGRGCAISTTSASLMTEILKGKTLKDAEILFGAFHANVTGGAPVAVPPELEDDSERLDLLTGVKTFPARVKCATLAWHAFEAAVHGGGLEAAAKTE